MLKTIILILLSGFLRVLTVEDGIQLLKSSQPPLFTKVSQTLQFFSDAL